MSTKSTLAALGDERFVSLTTFRRSGERVSTPVWVGRDGEALVVTTPEASGKVKRLRNDPRVELRPCSRTGRVEDGVESVAGVAEVLTDAGRRERLTGVIRKKYGLEYRAVMGIERLLSGSSRGNRVVLRITSDQDRPAAASTTREGVRMSRPSSPGAHHEVGELAGFEHGHADVNGTTLHYVVGGNGPAVVLLHGWPYTWAEWRKVMPPLAAAGHTVIAPDLRGVGDSAKPDRGYPKSNVAEDVRQLARGLGFQKIDLVGTDIGMMVAYAYAAAHPGEVRRLVLSESLLPGFGLEELMNPATGGYWHFGFHMQVDLAEILTAGKEAAYLGNYWKMGSLVGGIDAAAKEEYLRHYAAPGGMRGGFRHYATLLEDGETNRANFRGKLTTPVLVLNGEKGIPQEQTLEGVRRVAENVQAELVPNSGHAIGEDNPSWVAERLIRFCGPETEDGEPEEVGGTGWSPAGEGADGRMDVPGRPTKSHRTRK